MKNVITIKKLRKLLEKCNDNDTLILDAHAIGGEVHTVAVGELYLNDKLIMRIEEN